jgi:predicted nucleic acid-binding protein
MKQLVVDAWALLALLQGEEPAAGQVKIFLEQAQRQQLDLFISLINLGEVFYRIGKVKGEFEAEKTLAEIRRLAVTIVPVTEQQVFRATALKIRYPISYADAFAIAIADELGASLVTGDPELVSLRSVFQLEPLVRHKK